jgi:hypothetical protein
VVWGQAAASKGDTSGNIRAAIAEMEKSRRIVNRGYTPIFTLNQGWTRRKAFAKLGSICQDAPEKTCVTRNIQVRREALKK